MIPKIYDTQRIARIIGVDGDVKHGQVQPNAARASQRKSATWKPAV